MTENRGVAGNIKRLADRLPSPIRRFLRGFWRYAQGFSLYVLTAIGHIPSHHFRRFCYRHIFGIKLGRNSTIHWQARFFGPRGIMIGEYCNLGNNIFLDGRCGLTMGNNVATGSEVMIYTLQHDMDSPQFTATGGPVNIGDYVYIGPRAIILPRVTIGPGAVIAAGAVVNRDVPAYTVVGGVPAKFIRERPRELNYHPDFSMPFQ